MIAIAFSIAAMAVAVLQYMANRLVRILLNSAGFLKAWIFSCPLGFGFHSG